MDIHTATLEAEKTFIELIERLASIDNDAYNTVPFIDSWTAGQLAQHVMLSAGGFVQVLNGPAEDTIRDPEQHIQELRTIFLDFSTKMKSPDSIAPEEKHYNQQEQIDKLEEIKADFLTAINSVDLPKTFNAFKLPVLGYLTGAEAVTFAIVHTQRHLHQLKNIIRSLS